MNIFVIPSWYPSPEEPHTGIFFREQSELIARYCPDCNIGISTWGQNHNSLLLSRKGLIQMPVKILSRPSASSTVLDSNCVEYFEPTFTWTRKIAKGNIDGIVSANIKNLRRFEKKFGPVDILHAHVAYPGGYIAWQLGRRLDIPFVVSEHMTPFPFKSFQNNGLISSKVKDPLTNAHACLCVSRYLQNQLKGKIGVESVLINNFVDSDFFSPGEKQDQGSKTTNLLFVGRLVEQKGVDVLLNAFSRVLKKHKNVVLKIGGTGEKREEYHQLAKKLNVDRSTEWHGALDREQVRKCMREADVFILPSRHENNPVVLLEALACGVPIITTLCGGPEELVTVANGLISTPGDPEDLSAQIQKFLRHNQKYSSNMIRDEYLMLHDPQKRVDQIMTIYQSII